MLNSKFVGQKIVNARKKLNLSQAGLAKQVSISSQAVGKWERGESMPDITTLNKIAEILGVDLNYFSENFQSIETLALNKPIINDGPTNINWNMSELNLVDCDFSGLKNLHEKFTSANIYKCLFVESNMSNLIFGKNNIDSCDFTGSNLSKCHILNSNLRNNTFKNCLFNDSEFSRSNVGECNFTNTDFTKTLFKSGTFTKNITANIKWNNTSFIDMQIQDINFEGNLDGCFFENCTFYDVTFQNATLMHSFFKNNKKMKKVIFINCKADNITLAFLKSNNVNTEEFTIIEKSK